MPYLGPRCFTTAPLTTSNLQSLSEGVPAGHRSVARPSGTDTTFTSVSSVASSGTQQTAGTAATSLGALAEVRDAGVTGDPCDARDACDPLAPRDAASFETATCIDDAKTIVCPVSPPRSPTPHMPDARGAPGLLRKKSGELLKSSLKLNEYLHRSNSMPNTKNVKFAEDLENVKYFSKFQKPTAVSVLSHMISDSSDESDSESIFDEEEDETVDQQWEITSNDTPHNPSSLNFLRLNAQREVVLESVKLNTSKTALIGFVFVQNLAFKKDILVKLTYDNWQTFVEIDNANYISSNHLFNYSSNVSYDKFSFIVKLDLLTTFSRDLDIKFCIHYVANGQNFWDNNCGRNYSIKLHKLSKPTSPATQHTSTFDLDNDGIKLKHNYNFIDSFNVPPRHRNHHTPPAVQLKKVRSDSCLLELSYTLGDALEESLGNPLSSAGPLSPPRTPTRIPRDYNKLVETFCFYGSPPPQAAGAAGAVGSVGSPAGSPLQLPIQAPMATPRAYAVNEAPNSYGPPAPYGAHRPPALSIPYKVL